MHEHTVLHMDRHKHRHSHNGQNNSHSISRHFHRTTIHNSTRTASVCTNEKLNPTVLSYCNKTILTSATHTYVHILYTVHYSALTHTYMYSIYAVHYSAFIRTYTQVLHISVHQQLTFGRLNGLQVSVKKTERHLCAQYGAAMKAPCHV